MISICIPTFREDVQKQIEDIKKTIYYKDSEVIASCQNESTSCNRNYCLDKAKGEIIIMLDDDITGFFPNWDKILIEPLLDDNSLSIISARLMNKDNTPAKMMYDNFKYEPGCYPPRRNFVPTSCIAFRKSGIRFDEKYTGWGYEDTDFCKQVETTFPKKRVVINNNCKVIHLNEEKKRDTLRERFNRRYYHSKWGMIRSPKLPLSTILYYSSNLEDGYFENKIINNIMKVNYNLPIISITQRPMDFGDNICVGDVGWSYLNAMRQLQLGCKKATTPFVTMAESDCLYPKEGYFDFTPTDINAIYNYNNVWILHKRKPQLFYRKYQTNGSIIYGREFLIKLIDKCLKGLPMWSRTKVNFSWFSSNQKFIEFGSSPIINIISGANKRLGTKMMRDQPVSVLPYWGKSLNLCEEMFNGKI